jgi:V8-like Glu-specific endopeptidase
MSNLRNVLAGLYWDVPDQRRITQQAGLNPIFIRFSAKTVNSWQAILEEAQNQDLVQEVIAQAREEYPRDTSLAKAAEHQLLAIEAPEIEEDAWQGPTDALQLEVLTSGGSTLRPISFLARGIEIARSVARIVFADGSSGSGFLTQGDLLITNNHVIPSPDVAQQAVVEFNYQKTAQGLDAPVDRYELAPENGFATSPKEEQGGHDWTAVRVRGEPNKAWGALNLAPASPKVKDEVIVIQHPGGGHKQIALTHNTVAYADDRRLQYLTETLEGSSGSPVFNVDWQVVALHHAGGWLREQGSKRAVYRNQGIHINVVIDGLKQEGLL